MSTKKYITGFDYARAIFSVFVVAWHGLKSLKFFPREMSDLERLAYQAGYEAGLKGACNPYGRDTALYRAWKKGYGERRVIESAS